MAHIEPQQLPFNVQGLWSMGIFFLLTLYVGVWRTQTYILVALGSVAVPGSSTST